MNYVTRTILYTAAALGLDRSRRVIPSVSPPPWSRRFLGIAATILSWAVPVAFLIWAARLALLEGYLYEIPNDFLSDFTRTTALGAPTWWTGQGMFYGPIFVPFGVGRYVMGSFRTPAGPLYVNPGIGWFPVPIRFNCRPEITVFEV